MRRIQIASCLLLAMMLAAGSQSLAAQAPTRGGFFIGFGLGVGSLGIEGSSDRENGGSGYFKLGGALSPRLLLGAESNGWYKEEQGVAVTSGNLSAVAYFYPNAAGGFFLKGGLGLATLEVDAGSFGNASETGTGVTVGLGYDIGFGGRFALTPFANFVYSTIEGSSTDLFQLGLGVNWY